MKGPKTKHRLLSRRALAGSVGALSAPAPSFANEVVNPAAAVDPVIEIARRWIAAKEAEGTIASRWSVLEAKLIERCDWESLTEEEQGNRPEAQELRSVEEDLESVEKIRRQCRADLIRLPTATLNGLVAKLRVVADLVNPLDNWAAHELLCAAIQDLEKLVAARDAH